MKITCVIIDDQLQSSQFLSGFLRQIPGVEVINAFSDPFIARLNILSNNPDLIFLDVNIPNLGGLDYIQSIVQASNRSEVILMDQNDYNKIEVFHHEVFDYLKKPLNHEELFNTICRFRRKNQRQNYRTD